MSAQRSSRERRGEDSRAGILERLSTAYRPSEDAGSVATRTGYAMEPGNDPEKLLALARERFESQEMGYHILPDWPALVDSLANHLYSRQTRLAALQKCDLFERIGLRDGLASRLPDVRVLGPEAGMDEVARADVGITTCEAVIAQTGVLVLTGAERATLGLSLFSGVHYCIATVGQLTASLESWVASRRGWSPDEACVLVGGPSRTADIEKTVVVGVHGPWKVSLFLVKE